MLDFKNCCLGTREVVQSIKWLATRLKDPSSILSIRVLKKMDVGLMFVIPVLGRWKRAEGWESLACQPSLRDEFKP